MSQNIASIDQKRDYTTYCIRSHGCTKNGHQFENDGLMYFMRRIYIFRIELHFK